mmetsp:Transcript_11902/g.29152  ORF Transcript_11902/g.29152 Transcript_11902/m.29152 type:complete len:228 (-) Transcript_11902:86-769(-)
MSRRVLGRAFVSVGQAAVGGNVLDTHAVLAAPAPLDLGPSHDLDCDDASEGVEISVRHVLVLLLDRLEAPDSHIKPRVGLVAKLLLEPDGPPRASALGHLVVRPTRVPRQPDRRRCKVRILREELSDVLPHVLIHPRGALGPLVDAVDGLAHPVALLLEPLLLRRELLVGPLVRTRERREPQGEGQQGRPPPHRQGGRGRPLGRHGEAQRGPAEGCDLGGREWLHEG